MTNPSSILPWLFFELEEKASGHGIWWDPRRGVDALVRRKIDDANLETVEIRVDYFLKYLRARQMALVVGHYRHLHLLTLRQGRSECSQRQRKT